MRTRLWLSVLVVPALILWVARAGFQAPASRPAPTRDTGNVISLRATFGYLRTAPKTYDGSVSVTGGRLLRLEGWRFFQSDAVSGDSSWKLEVKRVPFENQPDRPKAMAESAGPILNVVPAGVVVTVEGSSSSIEFRTAQGNFSVPVRDVAWGKRRVYLEGDAVVERVPTPFRVSPDNAEQHDYPSLAVTRQGEAWTAWQAYQDRGDHVYARGGAGGPVRLTTEKADVYRTAVGEDARGYIHVAWGERNGEEWQIYERVWNGRAWGARRQITRGASPNIFHRMVSAGAGPLRMVWVGHENGESWLYMAVFEGAAWSAPQRIGGPGVWSPDAAADRQGNLYVAWDSYQAGNYDIFLRRIPASGAPDKTEQVTTSERFQAHPSLAIDGEDRVWLAWDESGANWGKDWSHEDQYRGTVLYADRSVVVAVKENGVWKQAGDFRTAVPERLGRYWQLPRLAVDAGGRVWAMFQVRTAAINNRLDYWCSGGRWDLYLTTLEDGVWRPASLIPASSGRPEAPFAVAAGATGGVWMAWATDNRRFGGPAGSQSTNGMRNEVYAARAKADAPAGRVAAAELDERRSRAQIMHPNEAKDIARIRAYRTEAGGVTYRILRGDFHRHTEISGDGAGDGSVEDYYRYMIDVAGMDTGIIGDHNMGGDVEYSWWRTEKSYDVFRIRGRFTPLFGYERSVAFPNGHRNVVFDHRGVRTLPIDTRERKGQINSGKLIYPYLRQNRGICMEHSLATNQGTDYRDNDPDLEPLVEIYQGYHASYEYKGAPRAEDDNRQLNVHGGYRPEGFWWNALAKGLKLGVQSSSDHISTHCSYAMIFTPDEDRGRIVENMRRRHAYAATDNIIVDFQAEEPGGRRHLMGEEFASAAPPKLRAKFAGTAPIAQVDLVRNNEFIYTARPGRNDFEFEYLDKSPRPGENYYYVRVMQTDGNMAWSSPIWIAKK